MELTDVVNYVSTNVHLNVLVWAATVGAAAGMLKADKVPTGSIVGTLAILELGAEFGRSKEFAEYLLIGTIHGGATSVSAYLGALF